MKTICEQFIKMAIEFERNGHKFIDIGVNMPKDMFDKLKEESKSDPANVVYSYNDGVEKLAWWLSNNRFIFIPVEIHSYA